jgi:molybdopterin converting factor small subunit
MFPVRVHVRLFGALRKYSSSSGAELTFDVPRGTPVSALRPRVADALRRRFPAFAEDGLLAASVLADERRVLEDGEPVGSGLDHVTLAVLPPVCGG